MKKKYSAEMEAIIAADLDLQRYREIQDRDLGPTETLVEQVLVAVDIYLRASERQMPSSAIGWRPIEMAPRDGTEVLVIATRHNMLVAEPRRHVALYDRGWWAGSDALSHVTHWKPLEAMP